MRKSTRKFLAEIERSCRSILTEMVISKQSDVFSLREIDQIQAYVELEADLIERAERRAAKNAIEAYKRQRKFKIG